MPRTYIKKALRQKSNIQPDPVKPGISQTSPGLDTTPCVLGTTQNKPPVQPLSINERALFDLCPDVSTTTDDKHERAKALYTKWIYEDTEEVVEGAELEARQRGRCKDIGRIVFGFVLMTLRLRQFGHCFMSEET